MRGQATELENIFANPISNRDYYPEYMENSQISTVKKTKTKNNPITKEAKDMKRHFTSKQQKST